MSAHQHSVPLYQFASAMVEADEGFAARVSRYAERFRQPDADTLAVLAQAAYFCWFEAELRRDLLAVCRAIGKGKPTSVHLCFEISPERWAEMNTYVVGVQRWTGLDRPLPADTNQEKVERIVEWLGARTPVKQALAELFLQWLVHELLFNVGLAVTGEERANQKTLYGDFTAWYARPDGSRYGLSEATEFVEECERRIRRHLGFLPESATEVMERVVGDTVPACSGRFDRTVDAKLASIGALERKGRHASQRGLPSPAEVMVAEAEAAIRDWLDGTPAAGRFVRLLHATLGERLDWKCAMVRDFLLAPKTDLGTSFCSWLRGRLIEDGATPADIFGIDQAKRSV